ncbi:sensor histidine kinase [Methylomarinum sp. Ch1-1]|uniref:histidine kinase n=1 Tax=Methylomarinum roseum TaxID=3067653 RepID=A0AAU7NZP4_9GAMM|nr:sensor histidine kinase [Methylomarinum sp. Ch1-1]MDP4521445.1 sensor histidine kinase [Methylomarinum sp. Ch1-1]
MNLQRHLLLRIVIVALACLAASSTYVLYRSDRHARQITQETARSLSQQLELQLLRRNAGFGEAERFPDFSLWKQTGGQPGFCLRFVSTEKATIYSLCNGSKLSGQNIPEGFKTFYRHIFNPDFKVTRSIALNDRVYGYLTVTPNTESNIARAWDDIVSLGGLSALTVLAVCILVSLTIRRALRPAGIIVDGLDRIGQGDLVYRLPSFDLLEWQHTATAINRLTASQQQLLSERQKLAVKLMKLQEEERRALARELHDEFGQCLAAINAVTASITQTAETQCPALVEESRQIGRISQHMMDHVRGLLGRLRPVELDELGLVPSLNRLVADWNTLSGERQVRFRLEVTGDASTLTDALSVTLFRIAQECMTNIVKHAAATNASVTLVIGGASVRLTVKDDGNACTLPFSDGPGIGLLGIRERVDALRGRLTLAIAEPRGLIVTTMLPVHAEVEVQI